MHETQRMRMLVAGAIFLIVGSFVGGFFVGTTSIARSALPASVAQAIGSGEPSGVDFSSVWKAWQIMDEKFVPASVHHDASSTDPVIEGTPEEKRVYGMISG